MLEYATKEVEVPADEIYIYNSDTEEAIWIEGGDKIGIGYMLGCRPPHRLSITFEELKQLLFSKYLGEDNDSRETD